MSYVVKFKDGEYHMSHHEGGIHSGVRSERARATRFVQRSEALRAASLWSDDLEPRIVRLKPRAKLDEAAIRADERKRIMAALDDDGDCVRLFGYAIAGEVIEKDLIANIKTAIMRNGGKP